MDSQLKYVYLILASCQLNQAFITRVLFSTFFKKKTNEKLTKGGGLIGILRNVIIFILAPIKQERKAPIHAGSLHPAMRERGRAIPSSHIVPRVDGRPDLVVPKMRPPMGGPGRVMPAPGGGGGSSMGIIMPLYTVGILLFFLYTMAKVKYQFIFIYFSSLFTQFIFTDNLFAFFFFALGITKKSEK